MVRKAVWLVIVAGAAGIAVTAALLFALQMDSSQAGRDRFINEADAIRAIKETEPHLRQAEFEPKFGYVKYEGVQERGDDVFPRISWYSADPDSAEVRDILHANITLYDAQEEIINEKKDRYVWTASYNIPVSDHIVFLDAETRQYLGEWVPCPSCICYHHGIVYK